MYKKILLPLLFLAAGAVYGQYLPAYPEVVRSFFKDHTAAEDYERWVVFAKKKDGWYVQHVNRMDNDRVLDEKLFWSLQEGRYLPPGDSFDEKGNEDTEEKISTYMNDAAYRWYDYERCRYFGYNGWAADMIKDFGTGTPGNDTLYEGLARAYSSTLLKYLWYQGGGGPESSDPLMQPLQRLETPGADRLDKVQYYMDLSIATYKKLEKRNPAYTTLVGNITMKRLNEELYGYNQFIMAGDSVRARRYIDAAEAPAAFINQARNYLNSCAPNAILFTFGDNDTYPLWYVQQKMGYRTDVAVINTSLLGLAVYPKMLRDRKVVAFAIPDKFLADRGADYATRTNDEKPVTDLSVKDFVKNIYTKKMSSTTNAGGTDMTIANYREKELLLPVNAAAFPQLKGFATAPIRIPLKSYILIDQLLTLDIIAENFHKRPICFVSPGADMLQDYFVNEGIVKRLLPLTAAAKKQYARNEMKGIEKYLYSQYIPVTTATGSSRLSDDAGSSLLYLVYEFASVYLQQKNNAAATQAMARLKSLAPDALKVEGYSQYAWAKLLLQAGKLAEGTQLMEAYALQQYNQYLNPRAGSMYLNRKYCANILRNISVTLKTYKADSNTVTKLLQQLAGNE